MKLVYALLSFITGVASTHALQLPPKSILSYQCTHCPQLSHENLSLSWSIEDKPLRLSLAHEQISRKYYFLTTIEALKSGVPIYTQAPGAIIRIIPHTITALNPNFYIKTTTGRKLNLQQVSSLPLEKTKKPLIFKIKSELGRGKFFIGVEEKTQLSNASRVSVHVFDKNAPTFLKIATDKARYQHGDQLKLIITLHDERDKLTYPIESIKAMLITPNEDPIELSLHETGTNTYEGRIDLLSYHASPEHSYIIVKAFTHLKNEIIYRQAQTAFSYALPSAAIQEILPNPQDAFSFSAQVAVSTGSRYALEAVLLGKDGQGKFHPLSFVQSASWLAPGIHKVSFTFDSHFKKDYNPPYYIGYLGLIDFGQLKPVYEYNNLQKLLS